MNNTIGTVNWFNDAKGYGYINTKEHENIFVHYSAIITDGFKTLAEGDTVTIDLVQGPKGYQAFNVKKIEVKP